MIYVNALLVVASMLSTVVRRSYHVIQRRLSNDMHADKTRAAGVPEIGKLTLAPYSMLALTLIGIAAAVYVAHGNYTGQPLWCPIVDGCNAVVNSPYSRVFGVPMSYFGFIYFLYMFALAARLAFDPLSRSLRFRAILYAAMGAVSSMYFMYLQLGFIREVCSYCLIAAVTTFLLLAAALWHLHATRKQAT